MVTVYTTETCGYCQMVKKYLKLKEVEFQEVDISEDVSLKEKVFSMTGMSMVPVIMKEDKFVVGWKPSELAKLIA